MQNEIYPYGELENSLEHHLGRHSRRSQVIYAVIVLALLVSFALLPIIKVGVSVQSTGIVRPATEKHEVKSRSAGFVSAVLVAENQAVRAGEVLFTLDAPHIEERDKVFQAQLDILRESIHDMGLLTATRDISSLRANQFRSDRYRQEFFRMTGELREIAVKEEKARRDLERAQALYARSLGPRSDVDDFEYVLAQLDQERSLLVERSQSGWQATLTAARLDLQTVLSEQEHLQEEGALYTVESPVDGTVEEIASVSPGSYVQPGDMLTVISPSSRLIAEVYVTPRDVGLLQKGTPVRVLVDAFNYSDWGFLTGEVVEIPSDFTLVGQQPVFRTKVALDRTHLQLKNGFRGELKKGMTLRARFMVAERTLLQLLRDDINDWLNPVQAAR